MDHFSPYHLKRARAWLEIEHFLGALPPHLLQQAIIVQHELATHYSDTGQFRDILSRPQDDPLLYWHFWLLDDLNVPEDERRTQLEDGVFSGMLYAFMATYLQERILDASSFIDNRFLFLANLLSQKSLACFTDLFPAESVFWRYHWGAWKGYAEQSLQLSLPRHLQETSVAEKAKASGYRLAIGAIPFMAIASALENEDLLIEFLFLMDSFKALFQTIGEIARIRRDLAQGRYTYPILRTMEAAGISPDGPVSPERLLGALILTGVGAKLCQACLEELDQCRVFATSFPLPTIKLYFEAVAERIEQLKGLLSLRGGGKASSMPGFFISAPDSLSQAIDMAERYLLSDLTFREGWEVQRQGLFDQPELIGQAFPSGLVIEILCQHGHALGEQVAGIFQRLQANRFRYYDVPIGLPDADDLGLLLRLHRYSEDKSAHSAMLETPLRWMEQSIGPSGEIPVWFVTDEPGAHNVLLWGGTCATVEMNLLLGLLEYDWERYQPLIERATIPLFERLLRTGLGATAHYTPLASLWILSEFLSTLAAKPASSPILEAITHLRDQISQGTLPRAYQATPQSAAFQLLSTLPLKIREFVEPKWLSAILKQQRYDGSWPGEPLYVCPNRGRATVWYSSNTVTTAFCYHALKRYAERRAS